MAVFEKIIALYVADRADARLRHDACVLDFDLDLSLDTVKGAIEAIAAAVNGLQ